MSYEVFIDVRHHQKHCDDFEEKESWCAKLSDGPKPLEHVSNALRMMADEIDPRFGCSHCGKTRGEHHREGGLYRCFNRLGPTTQYKWWVRA